MDLGRSASTYREAEDLFKDFRGRRAGMIKALTTDFTKFYQQCDPEKDNLCLYEFADETWEVRERPEKVLTEFPELVIGINLARDVTEEKRWLADVACHSDAWLLSFSLYWSLRFGFDKETRRQLFVMINTLPTISEVFLGAANNGEKETIPSNSSKDGPSSEKTWQHSRRGRQIKDDEDDDEDEHEDEDDDDDDDDDDAEDDGTCGACSKTHRQGEFWICCDACKKWYHAECVRITPSQAEQIKQYKCPRCCRRKTPSA
ncbi:PHD finger protein ALFIN-LIKE 6-like [Musa acuminata AAA Group]|uniref:PHD finger protein ALFIN-LIKE 6-like n=1 Tax=Musa acuminata AAA Group TaxID=214697 RepID=UPI0031DF1608